MNRVIAFHRWLEGYGRDVVVVASLSEKTLYGYRIGLPGGGRWTERFNSDVYDTWVNPRVAGNGGHVFADDDGLHGFAHSAAVTIPANSILVLNPIGGGADLSPARSTKAVPEFARQAVRPDHLDIDRRPSTSFHGWCRVIPMRSVGWVVISSFGAVGALGGVVLATVVSGGTALPFIGASMTLTGWGGLFGGSTFGIVGLAVGATVDAKLSPVSERLRERAEFLKASASEDLMIDALQVITCVATRNPLAAYESDAARSAAIDEVFGLSSAFLQGALRDKIDQVLTSKYDEALLNRSIARLQPFRALLAQLALACIRVVEVDGSANP